MAENGGLKEKLEDSVGCEDAALLHTHTHKRVYTQKVFHTHARAHKRFNSNTQTHLDRDVSVTHNKAGRNHVPQLLGAAKLAASASLSISWYKTEHKKLPSARKYFPILLCTQKLAETAGQHPFLAQSLHKALPCATSSYKGCAKCCRERVPTTKYYKVCRKYVPVLTHFAELAQNTSKCT